MSEAGAWQQVGSTEVYGNRWIRVTHDDVVLPDGGPGVYGVVEVRHDAVFVVATDGEHVALVPVDRYTTGRGWEIPSGGSDGEEPEVAARRELAEETGLSAQRWRRLAGVDSLNGVCRAPGHVFLAEGLTGHGTAAHGAAEEGIGEVRLVPWAEVGAMCLDGRIRDGESIAALGLAALALGRWR